MAAPIYTRRYDISTLASFVDVERDLNEIVSRLENIAFSYAISQLADEPDPEAGGNVSLLKDMIEVFRGVKPIE